MTARIASKTKQQAYSFKESAEAPASSSMTLASLPKRGPHSPSTALGIESFGRYSGAALSD